MWKRRWRIFAVQVAVGLVLFEVCLQIYNPLPFRVRGDRIVLPVHHRYTFSISVPGMEPVVHQQRNSLGFRGVEPPRDLDSRLSIITIGGSTTECRFLTDGKTWSDVLAARLAPAFPDVWVNNAGFDGHSSYGHLILLRQVIVPLRPKVALFLIGANDIGLEGPQPNDENLLAQPSAGRRLLAAAIDKIELLGIAQNLWRLRDANRRGLGHAWTTIHVAPLLKLSEAEIAARVDAYRPMVPGFRQRVEAIVQVSRDAGIVPVLITQPALYPAVDPSTGIDTATLEVTVRSDGPANGEIDWRIHELNNEVTRDVARTNGLLLIDLAREMPKDSRYYYDFIHYTAAGAVRVAEIVAAHLERFLRERFSGRRRTLE